MTVSGSQPAVPDSQRRWYQYRLRSLFLLMFLPALGVLALWVAESVVGYRRSGVAPSFGDLPVIGASLRTCEADGPIAYWFSKHPHGACNYLVCGHASESQIKEMCAALHLSNHVLGIRDTEELDCLNGQVRHVAQAAGLETYWKGRFQSGDDILLEAGGQTIGGYRRRDGWFSLNLVFVHRLAADDWQRHTR